MTSIRKFWWAGLSLALFVGCAEEQSTTTTTGSAPSVDTGPAPTTPPGGAPTATPGAPAAPSTPESKDADKGDTDKKDNGPAALPKVEGPKIDAPKPDADKDKSDGDKKSDTTKLSDDQLAEIKKLPPDDQVKAIKQMVCPVSGETLGDMGKPIKVTAEGKSFFLCCDGCKKDVDANAKAVLAKLKD